MARPAQIFPGSGMFYLYSSETYHGPLSLDEIQARKAAGHLPAETLYWNERIASWEAVGILLARRGSHPTRLRWPLSAIGTLILGALVVTAGAVSIRLLNTRENAEDFDAAVEEVLDRASVATPAPTPLASPVPATEIASVADMPPVATAAPPVSAASAVELPATPAPDPEAAVKSDEGYQKYLDLAKGDPTKGDAASGLANVLALVERHKTSALAHRCLARVQDAAGHGKEALESIAAAIALDPQNPRGWVYRARICARAEQLDEAASALKQAIKLAPEDPWVWEESGRFYARCGIVELANENLEKAEELLRAQDIDKRNITDFWQWVAEGYLEIKELDKAGEAYRARARVFADRGEVAAAREAYQLAASKTAPASPAGPAPGAIPAGLAIAAPALPAVPASAPEIARNAFAAVVFIKTNPNPDGFVIQGSGFLAAPNLIATNLHVVKGTEGGAVRFTGDDRSYPILRIKSTDADNDLAVLEIAPTNRKPLPLGDDKQVQVGADIFAIGSPMGLEGTFSKGNISGLRHFGHADRLQITAPLSSGSSGGPILNGAGEVIGISTSVLPDAQNVNFAVPVNYLKALLR